MAQKPPGNTSAQAEAGENGLIERARKAAGEWHCVPEYAWALRFLPLGASRGGERFEIRRVRAEPPESEYEQYLYTPGRHDLAVSRGGAVWHCDLSASELPDCAKALAEAVKRSLRERPPARGWRRFADAFGWLAPDFFAPHPELSGGGRFAYAFAGSVTFFGMLALFILVRIPQELGLSWFGGAGPGGESPFTTPENVFVIVSFLLTLFFCVYLQPERTLAQPCSRVSVRLFASPHSLDFGFADRRIGIIGPVIGQWRRIMRAMFVIVSLSLLASIAHAQEGAPKPGGTAAVAETPEYDRPVLARSYANGFGRRLANTILLLIDQRTVLRNLPLLGYGLGNVRNACESGPAPGPMIDGEVALVHEAYKEGRYFGPKFDFAASKVRWDAVCDWLDNPGEIFERSGLYVFDIMGRRGIWREFANEKAPPEDWRPFVAGRVQQPKPAGARGDFVRWTVEPNNTGAGDRWTLVWNAPGADSDAPTQAAVGPTQWWRYWHETDAPPVMALRAAEEVLAGKLLAAEKPLPAAAKKPFPAVDSLSANGEQSSLSATRYYMSYSAPESEFGSSMISTCGIGLAGDVPCSINWNRAPVPDPGRESGDLAFSLWYYVGEPDASPQAEVRSNWYLLAGEPLSAVRADIWVERSAFR